MSEQIIHQLQDMTYLEWAKVRNSSGTAGSFLKSYSDLGSKKIYYKLSNYNAVEGIVGHECVNEIIVDRLLTILGIEHLHYQLIHADILVDGQRMTTWLCASEDYKKRGENKLALDTYFLAERQPTETPMAFCIRNGWEDYIDTMLVVDYLILNRDRHGANIEVLRNSRAKTIRLAPLFDHGLSLLCSCTSEQLLETADVMEDKAVQSWVASRSAWKNVQDIQASKRPQLHLLQEKDKATLLAGLDEVLPTHWQDKIWDMIWRRWNVYESLCHTR